MPTSYKIWLIAAFVSVGPFMFGFDTGSIGSITVMPQFERDIGRLKAITRGLLVSIMLVTSAASGLVAGAISDRISRKYTIASGSAVFLLGSIISASGHNLAALFVGRAFAGLGEGLFLSIAAVYCVEISPQSLRGRITGCIAMGIALGICIGFFFCYGSVHLPSSTAWRSPFILQSCLSALYALGAATLIPFTPRWLHYRGRVGEAERVLDSLSRATREGEKEAFEMAAEQAGRNLHWTELFHESVRKRTLLACFLQAMQQLSGVDALLFYAPTLFVQAGITGTTASFLASGVSGLAIVLTTAATLPFMDRMSRRASTVVGGAVLGALMLLISVIYSSGAYRGPGKWVIIVSLYVWIVVFCATWSFTMRLYATEIQPLRTRAAVSSISTAVNQATNTLVALTIPIFLERTRSGPYWLFSGCLFLTAVVAWYTMPETRAMSLAEIDQAFADSKGFGLKRKAHQADVPAYPLDDVPLHTLGVRPAMANLQEVEFVEDEAGVALNTQIQARATA